MPTYERERKGLQALARKQARKTTDRAFLEELLLEVQRTISSYQKGRKYTCKQVVIPPGESGLFWALVRIRRKLGERLDMMAP